MVVRLLSSSVVDRTCLVAAEPAFAVGERLATVVAGALRLDTADTEWGRLEADRIPGQVLPIVRWAAAGCSTVRERLEHRALPEVRPDLAIAWAGRIAAGLADMEFARARFAEQSKTCYQAEQGQATHKRRSRKKRKEESN